MANIKIEEFDATRHSNPMSYIDNAQAKRHDRTAGLVPYKVCLVDVCGFQFVFHSVLQVELCLDYYRARHHPSGRLPVNSGNFGGDHWETQRWFEKLPQFLLEKAKRPRVVAALEEALLEYRKHEGAETATTRRALHEW